jgi:hypothetical protein
MIGEFKNKPVSLIVGDRVLQNYNFLYKLSKSRSNVKRASLLQNATPVEMLALVEIANNFRRKNSRFKLQRKAFNRLAPYADCIRRLSRSRSERTARKLVSQKGGGFLPALLVPILAEAAHQLISRFLKK